MSYERIIINGIPVFLGPAASTPGSGSSGSSTSTSAQAPSTAEGTSTSNIRPVFTWDTATDPIQIGRAIANANGTTTLELDADYRERCTANLAAWRAAQAARPRGQLRVRGDNPKPKIKKSRASA